MLRRKLYDELLEWKNTARGRSAALVEGARRVGKSTVVMEFAREQYDDWLLLDWASETTDVRKLFEDGLAEMDDFFRNLFALKGKTLKPRNAVIVFDEVQFFPKARQAIKYLVQDGRFDYIETGSLISIKRNVRDILIPSEEHKLRMYPMDYEEFLWAIGDTAQYEVMQDCFQQRVPVGEAIHRRFMQTFRKYMAVGGMPQAVQAFVNGADYAEVDRIKRDIISLYADDLHKNDEDNREKAAIIFQTIPEQLSNQNSHYRLAAIDKNARYRDYVDSVCFVEEAMIGNLCSNVTDPTVALELTADKSNFKLYMADTGLLVTQLFASNSVTDDNIYKTLIFGKLGINQGMIMENAVAQMLTASGKKLHFHEFMYKPKGQEERKYEIDFLLQGGRKLLPIEVKSSGYAAHKSFDYFSMKYRGKVGERFIIYGKDLKVEDGITYLPFYMAAVM